MKIIIIGAGVGGLGAACLLAKSGHKVTVLEKNSDTGGRAGQFKEAGFTFPYGPTWYLMPDVFQDFFKETGEDIRSHLQLKKVSPLYRVHFKDTLIAPLEITGKTKKDIETLERHEPNSAEKLPTYLRSAESDYNMAMEKFIYRNYASPADLLKNPGARELLRIAPWLKLDNHIGRYFLNKQIKQLLGYPAVFVGSNPVSVPAIYGMLNHAIYSGVFYPSGGIHQLVTALSNIAKNNGAKIRARSEVTKIVVNDGKAKGVLLSSGKEIKADAVISNAGLPNTELNLLKANNRSYRPLSWRWKKFSPSAVIIYLGLSRKTPDQPFHNFVLTPRWHKQFYELDRSKKLPPNPSLYYCWLSKYEPSVAPESCSGLMAIVPVSRKARYSPSELDKFADEVLDTIAKESKTNDLKEHVIYKKVFSGKDFVRRYSAYDGSMLGLSHTFWQTGPFRPQNKSKKIANLYYCGADTIPGIGVPMCLISAQLVAERIKADLNG